MLAAVLVAHRGLAGLLTPVLDGSIWLYDLVFLVLALPPVAFIGARLYTAVDPSADLLAETVAGSGENRCRAR